MRREEISAAFQSREVLGTRIDAVSYAEAVEIVLDTARQERSGYLCACNVHMVMEGHDDPDFQKIVNSGLLVVPDGVPLVWALRSLGVTRQTRVYGPELMLRILAVAPSAGVKIGLLGTIPSTLEKLKRNLSKKYPGLQIVYSFSPSFDDGSQGETSEIIRGIQESDAQVVFVAMGCPKQENWMAANSGRIPAVLLGVGAAFDFHAGVTPMAPALLQRAGLEWAFRFAVDPRRLAKRYLKHNPRFVALFTAQLLGEGLKSRR